ncbi:hypothetical protein M5D96_013268 [Drosophila gunungcola]|uniref:Uncharacterized protein n=1 Tax=Drosophila gunungcola TaxID=103775 RepID=A0A9P9YBN7_9MUSC|nr:hypothetical protein M5D96_013268 [Drosophila gunungcola]
MLHTFHYELKKKNNLQQYLPINNDKRRLFHVKIEVKMSKEGEHNFMMLPIEATESTDPIDGTEEIRRLKRAFKPNQIFKEVCIK